MALTVCDIGSGGEPGEIDSQWCCQARVAGAWWGLGGCSVGGGRRWFEGAAVAQQSTALPQTPTGRSTGFLVLGPRADRLTLPLREGVVQRLPRAVSASAAISCRSTRCRAGALWRGTTARSGGSSAACRRRPLRRASCHEQQAGDVARPAMCVFDCSVISGRCFLRGGTRG